MRWVRPARLPLLVAWLVIGGVIYYLASNPRLVAPYASHLVSRYLLSIETGGVRVRDFRFRMFEGLDLYGVSVTLSGATGGLTLVSADTVAVDFSIKEALGAVPRLRRVTVQRPEVYSLAGSADETALEKKDPNLDLPRLQIDYLEVSDAFLEFSGSDGRLAERITRADWKGSIRSGRQVDAVLQGCDADWETRDSRLYELRGELTVDNDGIHARSVTGRFNDHFVRVGGTRYWTGDLDLEFEGQDVSIGEVENLIDMTIGFHARGDAVGMIAVRSDSTYFAGTFEGELEGYDMQALSGKAYIHPTEILLRDLKGLVNGATFDGGGRFDVSNPRSISFVLEGDVSDVDMSRGLIPGEEDLPSTGGRGRLRIEHADQPLWTRVSGILTDGFIETIPFDSCFVDVDAYEEEIQFHQIEVFYRDLQALLTGRTDRDQVFRGQISLNTEDATTLPPGWGWPELNGRINGIGELAGPLDDIAFAGGLSFYELELDPVVAQQTRANLSIQDVLGDPVVEADVTGLGLSVGGVPLGEFAWSGQVSGAGAEIDTFWTALGDTLVTFRFRADFSDTLQRFQIESFDVDLEGTHWAIPEPVDFAVGDQRFDLTWMELLSDQGSMAATGRFGRPDVLDGSLRLDNFDLGLLNPFVESADILSGDLSAEVEVGGKPDAVRVDVVADLVSAPFPLADVDSLHVDAGFEGGTLEFQVMDLFTDYGHVRAKGTVSHPGVPVEEFWQGAVLGLDMDVVEGDWAFLEQFELPALDRLRGRFSGQLNLTGTTEYPKIRGRVSSAPFHIHWLHLDHLDGEVLVDHQTMVLGNLTGNKGDLNLTGRLELPLDFDLLSEPVTPLDGPFYLRVAVPEGSDLEPLERALNAFASSGGTGSAEVIVSGPLERPRYQGTVKIRDADFVIRNLAEVYRNTSFDGVFNGDELRITDIRGEEGLRGKFTGDGLVRFRGLELETFDIRLDLDRFLIASIPDLRVVASGRNARLTAVPVGQDSILVPKFTGDLEVLKARYTGDFSESGNGVDVRQATVAPEWLADLDLHAQPRVAHIINREFELDMGGDLNLIRHEEGMYLRGRMNINKGRMIVFNNNFEVLRGDLDFSQEVGLDPRIDLDAETQYRLRSPGSSNSVVEHIGVHVSGTLAAPEIRFSSERGYSREAIQRMLLGLEPYATPEGDAGRLRNSSITAGFNMLEREIARELAIFDTFEIDQIQRQREDDNTGLDPLIGVGKYIGSDLYLKYAQGIRRDDQDFVVEYQINQHLLLQSEVRRRIDENQGEASYNLDFKYRFEY